MRGWIIDRSSTAAEHGARGSGHYDMLLGLIPGSRRVQVGSNTGEVICPWDVPDARRVPPEKEQFLLALHALLIGDQRGSEDRTLSALEESFLLSGTRAVYERCARTGERPRETLLLHELQRRSEGIEPGTLARGHGAVADRPARALLRGRRVRAPHRRAARPCPTRRR